MGLVWWKIKTFQLESTLSASKQRVHSVCIRVFQEFTRFYLHQIFFLMGLLSTIGASDCTTGGRITISLSEFLSFGDISDEVCLIDWDLFIRRDLSVQGFRDLVDLTWGRNCRHANRKFTFVLTAAAACLKELQPIDRIQSTSPSKLPRAVTP